MLNTPPAFIDMHDEPVLIQAAVPRRRPQAALLLPRFAYAFVREHMDSLAALASVLRGPYKDHRDGG